MSEYVICVHPKGGAEYLSLGEYMTRNAVSLLNGQVPAYHAVQTASDEERAASLTHEWRKKMKDRPSH